MKLFSIAISASRTVKSRQRIFCKALVITATGKRQARSLAVTQCKTEYPKADGYAKHRVEVVEVQDDAICQVLASQWSA